MYNFRSRLNILSFRFNFVFFYQKEREQKFLLRELPIFSSLFIISSFNIFTIKVVVMFANNKEIEARFRQPARIKRLSPSFSRVNETHFQFLRRSTDPFSRRCTRVNRARWITTERIITINRVL